MAKRTTSLKAISKDYLLGLFPNFPFFTPSLLEDSYSISNRKLPTGCPMFHGHYLVGLAIFTGLKTPVRYRSFSVSGINTKNNKKS